VLIEWVDSRAPASEWSRLPDLAKEGVCICYSMGIVIRMDSYPEGAVSLAPNVGDLNSEESVQASGVISIPICSVVKVSLLGVVFSRKEEMLEVKRLVGIPGAGWNGFPTKEG